MARSEVREQPTISAAPSQGLGKQKASFDSVQESTMHGASLR